MGDPGGRLQWSAPSTTIAEPTTTTTVDDGTVKDDKVKDDKDVTTTTVGVG